MILGVINIDIDLIFVLQFIFLIQIYKLQKYSLKTIPFIGPHTGENIKDLFLAIMNEFNLNPNNIIVVSKI